LFPDFVLPFDLQPAGIIGPLVWSPIPPYGLGAGTGALARAYVFCRILKVSTSFDSFFLIFISCRHPAQLPFFCAYACACAFFSYFSFLLLVSLIEDN